jgi:hypothetical protein
MQILQPEECLMWCLRWGDNNALVEVYSLLNTLHVFLLLTLSRTSSETISILYPFFNLFSKVQPIC